MYLKIVMPLGRTANRLVVAIFPLSVAIAIAIAIAIAPEASATVTARTSIDWAAVAATDLAALRGILDRQYIYASYPSRSTFTVLLQQADARATAEVKLVKGYAEYRAVLLRYAATFADPHILIKFDLKPATFGWPGFAVQAEGQQYRVTYSEQPGIVVGSTVDSCDGSPVNSLADSLLAVETGLQGLPGPRARIAPWVFVDQGNPYYHRPHGCVIGGVAHTLDWDRIATDRLAHETGVGLPIETPLGLTPFGDNGAWIRLPDMDPETTAAASTWRELIDRAVDLRNAKTIVFDVRGNSGGGYEWFMAVLRSLYGKDYIAHFARARLQIRPIFVGRLPEETSATQTGGADPLLPPADLALNRVVSQLHYLVTPERRTVTVLDAGHESDRQAPPGPPAASPVHGKVYVLADSGCASACVSFIDEMKSIPGVMLVGAPTQVDMRSGSPKPFALPSGIVRIFVPEMVREGRPRGEDVGYLPEIAYDGDITATEEVQRWIASLP